jgi:HAD superfamily hydrolase (TIGR01509 family)
MRAKWLDMFELEGAMVELAHRLSEHYHVFLLSNIGDLHWAHLAREYRLHAIGHGALPSYVAGVMKPHPAIYAEAERRFALDPAATVFIDDRADNVATACARGWRGVIHRDYSDTRSRLQRLGVS